MLLEEFAGHPFVGGLVGDGFETVLAEFGNAPFAIRIGPGAALAIEAVGLIEFVGGANRVFDARLANAVLRHLGDGFEAGGGVVWFALLQLRLRTIIHYYEDKIEKDLTQRRKEAKARRS